MAEANADNAVPEEPSIGGFAKYVARGGSLAKKGAVPPPAKKTESDSPGTAIPAGKTLQDTQKNLTDEIERQTQ